MTNKTRTMEFNLLAHDLTGTIKTIEGLINILHYSKSKDEAQKIGDWIEQCAKKFETVTTNVNTKASKGKNSILITKHKNEILLNANSKKEAFNLNNIVYIIGSSSYITLHLTNDNKRYTFCKLLGNLEQELISAGFFRINRNTLINIKQIKLYNPQTNHSILMKTGEEFEVSRRRISRFKKFLAQEF